MSTPNNPVPFPPDPTRGPRDPDVDPGRDPDLTEPDITTPPGDDSPLIERPDENPDDQLPRDV